MDKGMRDTAVRSFFFQRAGPRSPSGTMSYVDLQWPVLQMHFTCNGRLPPRQSVPGPFSRLQQRAPSCNGEGEAATAKARLRRRRRGCDGEGEVATAKGGATAKARLRRRGSRAYCIPYIHVICCGMLKRRGG